MNRKLRREYAIDLPLIEQLSIIWGDLKISYLTTEKFYVIIFKKTFFKNAYLTTETDYNIEKINFNSISALVKILETVKYFSTRDKFKRNCLNRQQTCTAKEKSHS